MSLMPNFNIVLESGFGSMLWIVSPDAEIIK